VKNMRIGVVTVAAALLTSSAGVLGVGAQARAASQSYDCSSEVSPYSLSPQQVSSCGFGSFPLRSTTTNSNGSTWYQYDVGSSRMTYLVPPSSFDAATATSAELAEYGIPLRPPASDPTMLNFWVSMVNNLKLETPPTTLISIPATAGSVTNSHWAGYADSFDSGTLYSSAEGLYVEPSLTGTQCSSSSVVFWTGLGGYPSGTLAQDGTALNAPGLANNQAWSEFLPAQPGAIPQNLYATPGQDFYAQVTYVNADTVNMYMYNSYTGLGLSYNVTGDDVDEQSAEYIAERPALSGVLRSLSDFGTAQWLSTDTNGVASSGWPHDAITMQTSHVLASPSANSAGSFNVAYKACS